MDDTSLMRYIGIDYGSKRIGIAVSDGDGSIAFPRATIPNDPGVLNALAHIIEIEKVAEIVIGDTRAVSGAANPITAEGDAFAERLEAALEMPIHRVREAWSSAEAMRFAPKGKRHDDSSAAAIILQRFLDARKK